jgi:hypothetical protein
MSETFPVVVNAERLAQMIAHRACCGVEHDTANGKLHGCCVVCGVPWPCEYAGPTPTALEPVKVPDGFAIQPTGLGTILIAYRDGSGVEVRDEHTPLHGIAGVMLYKLASALLTADELRPAEPMAKHWRQAMIDELDVGEYAYELIEQRARELAKGGA